MIFKSYIIEQNLQSIINNKAFLFYGENQGLKKEFKEKLVNKYKGKGILNLFQDDIIKNEDILINEIANKSLFDEQKIIFINQSNDKVLEYFDQVLEKIQDEKIFLFSDTLDKKSKLRNYFEKSKNCGITACYQDNEITIRKIIMNKLSGYKGLSNQIINLIIDNTGMDRNKVNNEIEKIISCFADKVLDLSKLDLLLNIRTSDDFNILKDEALKGNKIMTNKLLADTVFETESAIYYLNSINQRINKLKEIENMKDKNSNIEVLISNLKPPVFWKDKPTLLEQSRTWSKNKILVALEKTYAVEIKLKSNSTINKELLIKNLIVDLCYTATSA